MASPISSKTRECLKLFTQVVESTKELGISAERSRFDKWSRNIGAHQKGSSSLDQRLQDASHIRDVVVELLDGLVDSLTQMVEISKSETDELKNPQTTDSEWDVSKDELEESVHVITSSLLKLAIAVRNPAPVDRYVKSRTIDMSYYKAHDLAYLEELYPGIDGYLKERMTEATLQRRRFLEYSARHHFKLARDSSPVDTEEEADDAASIYAETTASSLPAVLRSESSTFEAAFDTRSERSSFTSYASSGMGTRPRVPQPPADAVLGGDPFECPYCRLLVSPQDTYNWKKHVFHDLQPYVCTFEKCEDPDHLYRSRHEWFDHELAMHRREWVCPGHCDEVFVSRQPFESHLAANYAESAGPSLPALMKTCERPTLPSASVSCPFCLEMVVSRKKIRNHIGQHLTDISLRVLPTTTEETESSESEPQNESTDSEHTKSGEKPTAHDSSHAAKKAVEDLRTRVQDWKGHNLDRLGKLLLHGTYNVEADISGTRRVYELYLFETLLLCCRPVPIKKKWFRRDKNDGPKQKPEIQLKGRIFIANITDVLNHFRAGKIQIFWKGDPGIENFTIDLGDEATASEWTAVIQERRLISKTEPEGRGSSFVWMRDDIPLPNPYTIEESDDDSQDLNNQNDNTSFQKTQFRPLSPPPRPQPGQYLSAPHQENYFQPVRERTPPPQSPIPAPQLKAKVMHDDAHLTFWISASDSYQAFIDRVDQKLGRFSEKSISSGQLKLRWRDEDGDFVNISNDDDLQLALTETLQRNATRIFFSCVPSEPTARYDSSTAVPIDAPSHAPIQ